MDLWIREARLFKYGSGTGIELLALRGENEPLSGGGKSSGLMSFLKIGDRAAGAIKSGGTTRRAAKMVLPRLDHPDIEEFINWKVREEQKVAALVAGSKAHRQHLDAILRRPSAPGRGGGRSTFDPQGQPRAQGRDPRGEAGHLPEDYVERVIQLARRARRRSTSRTYDTDWNSEAYLTVSGQNSNNSVRVTDDFMKAVRRRTGDWDD